MLCIAGLGNGQAQVTSNSELSNDKVYTVTTARGAWMVDQTNSIMSYNSAYTSSEATPKDDVNYQFAFVNYNGHYYLYAPAVKKFVQPQKYFITGYSTPVTLAASGSDVKVKSENSNLTINIGGSQWTWDTWTAYDDGNKVTIIEAADFDATEAISILTSTPYFDPHKVYNIACERVGYWAVSADHNSLSSTLAYSGATDAEKQFAFYYDEEGKMYIYSVGAGKFLNGDGSLATGSLGDPMDYRIVGTSGYFHMLFIPATNCYFNSQNGGGYAINTYAKADVGNLQKFEEVTGLDVYDQMDAIVNPSYVVTYVVKDEAGNTLLTSDPLATTLGTKITTIPSDYARPFYTYNDVDVTISGLETTVEFTATWAGPFKISTDFASAHWYDMAMRGTWYVTSAEKAADGAYATQNANTMGLVEDSYQWAFLGNGYDGFKIINKAEGDGKSFGWTDAQQTDAGIPTVMDDGEGHHIWNVVASTNTTVPAGSFVLNVPGTNLYINQYGGAGGSVKFWNSANNIGDNGSAFTVFDVPSNFASFVADEISPYFETSAKYFILSDAAKTAVGYDESKKTECSFADYKAMKEALATTLADADNYVYPETGYYRLLSRQYPGRTISYADNTKSVGTPSAAALENADKTAASVVKLTALDDHKYTISVQGLYLAAPSQSVRVSLDETATEFTAVVNGPGYGTFTTGGTYQALHAAANDEYFIVGWTADAGASQWTVEDAEDIELTVGETGFATTYLPFPVTAPEGVTVYTGTIGGNESSQWLTLSELGSAIPEATPVILKANANDYTFTIGAEDEYDGDGLKVYKDIEVDGQTALVKAEAGELTGNALKGTFVPIDAADKYILAKPEAEEVGFYKAITGKIAACKAYLEVESEVKAFYFNFDDATGISEVESSKLKVESPIYNIAGQRLQKTQKGINIVNGKKIVMK